MSSNCCHIERTWIIDDEASDDEDDKPTAMMAIIVEIIDDEEDDVEVDSAKLVINDEYDGD